VRIDPATVPPAIVICAEPTHPTMKRKTRGMLVVALKAQPRVKARYKKFEATELQEQTWLRRDCL